LFLLAFHLAGAQTPYQDHFTGEVLRLDFLLAGGADSQMVYLDGMKKEQPWAGPRDSLVHPFGYGNYQLRVTEASSSEVIYTRGFSTLFEEWQATRQAKEHPRAFAHTIRMPFPRGKVWVRLYRRQDDAAPVWQRKIDPSSYFITREKPAQAHSVKVAGEGEPSRSVDLAFLAEGYRKEEMEKFVEDVRDISNYILSREPFKSYRDRFNIYAVKAVSDESGTDVPGEHIYRNTVFNSSYYTFDVPRYLTSFDTHTIRDYAANVPYDHIVLLINTERYGGGGFYNHYSATTTDHMYSKKVAIHEFGHGFAGLGDEYYNSEVAYSEFYNLKEEPWEPNLTTLVDFESKWKDMLSEETPVPTPRKPEYSDKVGVFEGGGYVSEGVYSPFMDCRMKSNRAESFCPVCRRAIEKMILYYLDGR